MLPPTALPLIPIGLLPISAASGLVAAQGMLWTIGDDETVLLGTGSNGLWDQRIELVPDRLPLEPVARKRRKPDFESIARLPGDRLFVLGSGSKPARRRGVVVDLHSRHARVVDLTALYRALESEIADLNVEGAVVLGGALFLAHRRVEARFLDSNTMSPLTRNALVRLDLRRVLESLTMRSEVEADAIEAIRTVELPSIEGVPLGLTDLASDGAALFFVAAAEDSASSYDDGACLGSVLGRLALDGGVVAIRSLEGREKIEGLTVRRSTAGDLQAWLVSDPDDRAIRAQLFRVDALGLV